MELYVLYICACHYRLTFHRNNEDRHFTAVRNQHGLGINSFQSAR